MSNPAVERDFFYCLRREGNIQDCHVCPMTRNSRIALFQIGEVVDAALRAKDAEVFRCFLSEGIEELGVTEVEELLLDWLYSFLTPEEQDRLMGWHLGVSL